MTGREGREGREHIRLLSERGPELQQHAPRRIDVSADKEATGLQQFTIPFVKRSSVTPRQIIGLLEANPFSVRPQAFERKESPLTDSSPRAKSK